jgi:radical SAM protein with 4Fe4S-binding SPASM domain
MKTEKYIFNPAYHLFNDSKRIIVSENPRRETIDPLSKDAFAAFIHPVHALALTYFDGEIPFDETVSLISENLDINLQKTIELFKLLVENEEQIFCNVDKDITSVFPPRTLIPYEDRLKSYQKYYSVQDLFIPHEELDFITERFFKPLEILHVINLKCHTNCIYCYADKKNQNGYTPLSHKRILELIDEAHELGIKKYDFNGGEVLLQHRWEEILERATSYNFAPYISTKMPLTEDMVKRYKNTGMEDIQISIDSLNEKTLKRMVLANNGYLDELKNTFYYLEKHDISVSTNSIITNYNKSEKELKDLFDFLLSYENIKTMRIAFSGYSLHISDNNNAKMMVTAEDVKKVKDLFNLLKPQLSSNRTLIVGDINTSENDFRFTQKNFSERARCTGNLSSFCILPDGKATYCEELYWHPAFIIGDLSQQSINEMWNSDRAKSIFAFSSEMVSEKSVCKECSQYEKCRPVPGVCFKEIIGVYGKNNWDYPDPRCPYAPDVVQSFFHKSIK